jgi:hypothetical protein
MALSQRIKQGTRPARAQPRDDLPLNQAQLSLKCRPACQAKTAARFSGVRLGRTLTRPYGGQKLSQISMSRQFFRCSVSLFQQVSVAEDKRFELLRGCPQHAFQQC